MLTLVVGCGYLGSRVLEALPNTIGLSRSCSECDVKSRELRRFDIDRDKTLPTGLGDEYQVLYTVPPSAERLDADVRLERFLDLLVRAPNSFVYISTTGVYGSSGDHPVDETTPIAPSTDRGKRRVAAERGIDGHIMLQKARRVVLRVPGIYGPGRLGIEKARSGEAMITEADAAPGNRIHIDDLVRCSIAAFCAPAGVYNVGDGDHRNATAFRKIVASELGIAPPPEISREQARAEFSARRWSFLKDTRRIDTQKMRTVLGVVPRFAILEEGIRASLENPA